MVNQLEYAGRWSDEFTRKQQFRDLTVGSDKGLRREMPPYTTDMAITSIYVNKAILSPL